MDCFGTAVSMSLQYGVPLEVYVNKFSHTRFEPMGFTKNPDIRIAKSIVDYIFRWMGLEFLPGYREATMGHVPAAAAAKSVDDDSEGDTETEPKPAAMKAGGLNEAPGLATRTQNDLNARRSSAGPDAAKSANGHAVQANGHGGSHGRSATANGHSAAANGHSAAAKATGVVALLDGPALLDSAALLDRAGVRMKVDENGGPLANRTEQFARFQTDAPACENCGAITVRNGNCYLCHNCGNSMGCS
jgi:ribonucleoside-diphosphate reductase alpha chain